MADQAYWWTQELAEAAPPDPLAAGTPVLDGFYLARQCEGDEALERELLGLFAAQAQVLCAALRATSDSPKAAADLAHRLKGAAAAVGAARVAAHAAWLENLGRRGPGARPGMADAVAPLERAVADACALIATRLAA